jgi:hypothetical protein
MKISLIFQNSSKIYYSPSRVEKDDCRHAEKVSSTIEHRKLYIRNLIWVNVVGLKEKLYVTFVLEVKTRTEKFVDQMQLGEKIGKQNNE